MLEARPVTTDGSGETGSASVDGPVEMLVELLAARLGTLTLSEDGASSPENGGSQALQTAEIFNEHGFFARAPWSSGARLGGGVSDMVPDAPSPLVDRLSAAGRPILDDHSAAIQDATIQVRDAPPHAAAHRQGTRPHSAAAAGDPGGEGGWKSIASPANAGRAFQPAAQPRVSGRDGGAPRRSPMRAPSDLSRQASAASAQLSLEVADRQVNIAARTEKLSREERARLRLAIAQLLASHGFAAGEVRLNGEIEAMGQDVKGDH